MNKTELVEKIAETSELSKADAKRALEATIESISDALANGEDVQLVGFGTFSVAKRAARQGRNPQTGEEMSIPESNAPKFKAGKALKDRVN